MVNEKDVVARLASIVGKANVSAEVYDKVTYSQDALGADLGINKLPVAVVRPGSAQEVSQVIKYANENKIPVYIHGAGSAFKGSSRPKRPDSIILDTTRLDFFEMHEEDDYFEVGPGTNQYNLEKALADRGYLLPMNTGNKYAATVGGGIAVNTIGHMNDTCVGKIGDYVMGLEAVLPTGEIIETGTKSIRRPAGLDLTRFLVGGEGLFGVITRIRMRLVPMPKKSYVVGFFKELEDAAHAFQQIYKEKLAPPLYGELLGKDTAVPAFRARGLGEPPGHMALATTIASSQEEADHQAGEIARVFQAEHAIKAYVVKSAEEQVALWDARDFITNMRQREEGEPRKPRGGGFEMGVPLSRLADFFTYIKSGPPNYPTLKESTAWFYGHVSSSGPHVTWAMPVGTPRAKELQAVKESRKLEKELTVEWGGIGGELGQTAGRISAWRAKYGEAAYQMAVSIKKAVDPNNILNPGNLEGEGYED